MFFVVSLSIELLFGLSCDNNMVTAPQFWLLLIIACIYKVEALGQCIPPPRYVACGCLSSAGDLMTS